MLYLRKSGLMLSWQALDMLQGIELHNNSQCVPVLRAVMLDGSVLFGCVALDDNTLVAEALDEASTEITKYIEEGCMGPSPTALAACIKARARRA